MLNKKDPLIDAIKQVMQNNQADRDAVKAVNEKFGIQDRRVLPHERQGSWDAAYQTVLNEASSPPMYNVVHKEHGIIGTHQHGKGFTPSKPKLGFKSGEVPNGAKIDHSSRVGASGMMNKSISKTKKSMDEESLEEKTDPSKYSEKQRELAGTAGNTRVIDGPDLTHVRKHGGKHIGEEGDPSKAIPGDTVTGGSSVTTVPKPKPTSITQGQKDALTNKIKSIKEAKKASMCEATLESIHEEIAYNLAEQAAYILENQGEDALLEFYVSLTEEQRDIVEGWMDSLSAGARGAWNSATLDGGKFVRAGADYLAKNAANKLGYGKGTTYSKELDQEREKDTEAQTNNPTAYSVGDGIATGAMLATGLPGVVKAGARIGGKMVAKTVGRALDSKVGQTASSVSSNAFKSGVAGHAIGGISGQHKGQKDAPIFESSGLARLGTAAFQGAKALLGFGDDAAKAAGAATKTGKTVQKVAPKKKVPLPPKATTAPASQSAATAGTMAARAQQLAQAGKKAQAARAGGSTVKATQTAARTKAASQAQGSRVAGSTVKATQTAARTKAASQAQGSRVAGSTVKATQTAARTKAASQAQGARAGGSTVKATQTAARTSLAQKVKDMRAGAGSVATGAVNAVKKYPKLAAGAAGGAALGGFAATQLGNKPSETQAGAKSTVAMTARKIEATPRKVSDSEVMNAPEYKQGVKAVGGEAGARKIQPGTDVAGVGKVDKGQTIWSKVKSQLEKQPVKGFEAGANKGGAGR